MTGAIVTGFLLGVLFMNSGVGSFFIGLVTGVILQDVSPELVTNIVNGCSTMFKNINDHFSQITKKKSDRNDENMYENKDMDQIMDQHSLDQSVHTEHLEQ